SRAVRTARLERLRLGNGADLLGLRGIRISGGAGRRSPTAARYVAPRAHSGHDRGDTFYLLTAFAVVVALPWQVAASSTRPLTEATEAILGGLGLPTGL